jgi:hypothetical protein
MVTGEGLDYTPWCSAVDWAAVWVNIWILTRAWSLLVTQVLRYNSLAVLSVHALACSASTCNNYNRKRIDPRALLEPVKTGPGAVELLIVFPTPHQTRPMFIVWPLLSQPHATAKPRQSLPWSMMHESDGGPRLVWGQFMVWTGT